MVACYRLEIIFTDFLNVISKEAQLQPSGEEKKFPPQIQFMVVEYPHEAG